MSSGALRYAGSRKNLTGSALGLVGLGLTFTGLAGAYWPFVVAGLYGAGALLAPPERPPAPVFPAPAEHPDALREDLAALRAHLASAGLPAPARAGLDELTGLFAALLAPGWTAEVLTADPEAMHTLRRAVRQDVPEAVDAYLRTRWWTRVGQGGDGAVRHLDRQVAALRAEAGSLAAAVHEAAARRQEIHTRYLEERGGRG
ncbi:hypothetical protein ACFTXJ_30725 [Streptomyces zhihengii]|uniref:hypothetical protein n=1 Tax=Streptomyces zhihengii TaxID=1818004 RepID=UPI0036254DC1